MRECFLSKRSKPFPEEVDIIFLIDYETEANALSAALGMEHRSPTPTPTRCSRPPFPFICVSQHTSPTWSPRCLPLLLSDERKELCPFLQHASSVVSVRCVLSHGFSGSACCSQPLFQRRKNMLEELLLFSVLFDVLCLSLQSHLDKGIYQA